MKSLYQKLTVFSLAMMLAVLNCACTATNREETATTSSGSEESLTTVASPEKSVFEIDFTKIAGDFKPVNGINNGPKVKATLEEDSFSWYLDATDYYKELGITYVRTHDMEYPHGSDLFIDVHCIFPDFEADVEDPASYYFDGTDEYIANIIASGAEVFYRLGESISYAGDTKNYQDPPEDYEKWAQICDHIISHYNEGWNNGFQYNIKYWEIWNEPDQLRQWNATVEEYYRFYAVAATYLKERHPDCLIGGGVLAVADEETVRAFLNGIKAINANCPLDFYSWHIYDRNPSRFDWRARIVREALDENGYEKALIFCDEWNYVEDWNDLTSTWEFIASSDIVSYYSGSLINMLHLPIDGAMYYDGSIYTNYAKWCGLYTREGEKLPGYYAFQCFAQMVNNNKMVDLPEYDNAKAQNVYICAGTGEKDVILISNMNEDSVKFVLKANSEKNDIKVVRVNRDYPNGILSSYTGPLRETEIELQAREMLCIIMK